MVDLQLRPAQEADLAQIVNLDRLSFAPRQANSEVEQDWYGGTLHRPGQQAFLAIDPSTDQAIGTYSELDLEIWLEGQSIPSLGIAGVAVAPHKRGQSIARRMLEQALEHGRLRQLPLSMLYPFQHGFYRKLGWAWVGRSYQYRVLARDLPTYAERSGMLPYHSDQQQAIQALYQSVASQHNGWLQRQPWHWQAFFKPNKGREIYLYTQTSEPLGYVVLQFTALPPHNRLAIVVQEWVALTIEAYRGIVGFLASLRDQVNTIVWNTDITDPLPHLLKEQRQDPTLATSPFEFGLTHRFGEIGGGFMWRLLDLKQAIALRRIRAGDPFALTFHVTDPILGEQTIAVEFADGRMYYLEQASSTTLRTSIDHLTELFSGLRRATDLHWTGELELEGDAALLSKLDAAWQATPPFCWDFF